MFVCLKIRNQERAAKEQIASAVSDGIEEMKKQMQLKRQREAEKKLQDEETQKQQAKKKSRSLWYFLIFLTNSSHFYKKG